MVSLAKSTYNHHFLSLHLFTCKSHHQGTFLLGWNRAACYTLLNWQLTDLHGEGFVKTGEMKVCKLKGTEERNN